jgi:hypothetical protein
MKYIKYLESNGLLPTFMVRDTHSFAQPTVLPGLLHFFLHLTLDVVCLLYPAARTAGRRRSLPIPRTLLVWAPEPFMQTVLRHGWGSGVAPAFQGILRSVSENVYCCSDPPSPSI